MDGDHDLHTIAFRAAIAGANAIRAVSADQLATQGKDGIEDFVTAADLASEQAIIKTIRLSRPDDQIIAEETGNHPGSSGVCWYVDPLDGTANVVAGSPDYAVCISAHRDLKTLAAIIYRPADDLWLATSAAGRLHGTLTPRLAAARPLDATRVTVSRPHDPVRRDEAMALRQTLLPHVGQEQRVGSAACALLRVAVGDLDAYVSVDLPMWDTAAGHHLVALAGGLVTTITSSAGTPITVAGAPTATDAITALLATMSTQPSYMESLKPNLRPTMRGGMEKHEIEIFLALADELHFGRSAQRLMVSTTHVSKSIRRIENRIGAPLFERTSRKVTLTPVGEQLYAELAPAYARIQESIKTAISTGRGVTGTLRVGYIGAAGGSLLLTAATAFQLEHPDCDVRIKEQQLSDGLDRLRNKEIDLMLTGFPVQEPDLVLGPVLISNARVLAVSSRNPLARRSAISLEDLADVPMIRNPPAIPEYWNKIHNPTHTPSGRPIPSGPVASTFMEALALVGADRGVYPATAQVSQYYRRPDVVYLPVVDAVPLEWGLVWFPSRATGVLRAFVESAVRTSGR